ncbi:General alpha-glucoside permease [Cyphellophora attinorum]|uniref:General alpha-glucoside permease n=1 Tax=Cyphellophora attinorum TaxID=1664694 RepID=A0A0N0NJC6_9EURO|nr:General alpha-glucoside permease [Phialophora attinorum]KPI36758.1 General alpha-glucoside permease [Phialophora attinorum]
MHNQVPEKPASEEQVESVDHDNSSEDLSGRARLAQAYAANDATLSFWQTIKLYHRSILWTLYGQLVVFGYGIDGVIAAFLLGIPRFRQDFGEAFVVDGVPAYIISANWIAIFSGVSQLTAILGAVMTGYLADRLGRKITNAIFCAISIAAVGAQVAARGSLPILCVGKGLNGFSIGAWLVIGPLYASEIAPLKLRGWLTAVTNTIQFSGVLLFTGVIYVMGPMDSADAYQIPFMLQWIIPSFVLLTIYFWPESPVYLVNTAKRDKAIQSLQALHGSNSRIDQEGILAQIEETLDHEKSASTANATASYAECFNRHNRSRTLISMWIYACQYLGGLVFVLGYQSYYYQLIGFGAKKSFFLTMLNNSFQFIANILSWFLISALGRRPLIVWGELCGTICLFIIGGCSLIGTNPGYLATVSFMFVWAFTYQLTLGTVAWTVVAEIPSLRLRAKTQGLANLTLCFFQWAVAFVFPYMFNPDAGNLGGKVGFVFGATSLLGFLGVFWFLPETKNRTADQLDKLYAREVPARKFHKTVLSDD